MKIIIKVCLVCGLVWIALALVRAKALRAGSGEITPHSGSMTSDPVQGAEDRERNTEEGNPISNPESATPNPQSEILNRKSEIPHPLPPVPTGAEGTLAAQGEVLVEGFDFVGNTVFTDEELEERLAEYTGRRVTVEELETARKELTLQYVEAGYVTSGALLPDQEITSGRVTFQLVEGVLTGIQVEHEGKKRLYDFIIRSKIKSRIKDPLNLNELQTSLQLLDQDPNIRKADSEIKPTGIPGQSELELRVKENQPWYIGLLFENHRSPSVGAMRPSLLLMNHNVLGFGDSLSLSYGLTTGKIEDTKSSEFNNLSGSYTIPLNGWGTTLAAGASKSDSAVVEDSFAILNIISKSTSYFLELNHPLYKTLADDVAVSLKGEHKENRTFLLGEPDSFSDGSHDGVSIVTALRGALTGTHRTPTQVFSGRAALSIGLDAWEATLNTNDIPDGRFKSLQLQGQYVRRVKQHRLIATVNSQYSGAHRLLPLEQFSIGGSQTVRGYRENKFLNDNGVNASLEFRFVLWADAKENPVFELAPFYDYGYAWGAQPTSDADEALDSIGLGTLYHWRDRMDAEVYWGHPLRKFESNDYDLQDDGLHFQVRCRIL